MVTYGLKFDPVAKLAISASFIDFIFLAEILEVLLNSCSSIVHWYSCSYIKCEPWNCKVFINPPVELSKAVI